MILTHIYDVDISQPLLPTILHPMMVTGDKLANRIGVRLKNGAQPYTPDGSCRGYVLRADGATVPILDGVVNGNEMYIDLPEAAYAVQGSVVISIVCVTSTAITTVFLGSGTVNRSQTDVVIDPGTVIDDISTLIQAIETAVASIPEDYSTLSSMVDALTHVDLSISGKYIASTGVETANSDYSCTDYIPVNSDSVLILDGFWTGTGAYAYMFYTAATEKISGANSITSRTVVTTIPSTAAYVRFSSRTSQGETPVAYVSNHVVERLMALTSESEMNDAAIRAAAAPNYAGLTFPVSKGTYCWYQGILREANQDISTSESWTAAHWDTAVIGEDVADLKSAFISSLVSGTMDGWQKGGFNTTNGANYTDATRIRNQTKVGYSTGVCRFKLAPGYSAIMFAWDLSGNYVGAYKTDESWTAVASGWKSVTEFDLSTIPNYVIKFAVARVPSSSDIAASEGANCILYYYTDKTLTAENKAADAKATGDRLLNIERNINIVTDPKYINSWSQGYISTNGATGNSPIACVTPNYYQFSSEKRINISVASGYVFKIAEYTTNAISSFVGLSGNVTEYVLDNSSGHYYRLELSKADQTAFTPENIPSNVIQYEYIYTTDKTLSIENKSADAKATGDRIKDTVYHLFNARSSERFTVICNMQSGHGFTNPFGSGSAPTDDTTDYLTGTQSVFFNYAGQSKVSNNGIDLTNATLGILLKVDSITSGSSIKMYISDVENMSKYRSFTLYAKSASDQFETGLWRTVSVYSMDGAVSGPPDMTKIKYIRFTVSGSATYHIQSVGYRQRGSQRACISFTFDDGWSEQMLGAKVLGKYNIPATAYIFRGCELTLEQLKSLKEDYGWDIEMHGANDFTVKTEAALVEELTSLQEYIRGNGLGLGEHIAYPGGQNSQMVANVVSRFCKSARTINNGSSKYEMIPPVLPYNMRAVSAIGASGVSVANVKTYIDGAVNAKAWLMLVFHRIGNTETSMFCTEAELEEIAAYAVASGADIKTVADMWERN